MYNLSRFLGVFDEKSGRVWVTNKAKGALRGCVPLSQFAARKYVHPISGHHMYVVPYHLSPTLAVAAKPLIKKSFEDAVRMAVSLGADADTLGAIVGSIAEAIWGIPLKLRHQIDSFLPDDMCQYG